MLSYINGITMKYRELTSFPSYIKKKSITMLIEKH